MLFTKAINKDGRLDCVVEKQLITKYFNVMTNSTVNQVETVYVDEDGYYFCTMNEF